MKNFIESKKMMKYVKRFHRNIFTKKEMDIAFSRTHPVDEYKHNVNSEHLLDLPGFKDLISLNIMHNQVAFIFYSEEALNQWNIGNYVYPHKDGSKELDPFHVSLVAPMENYEHSMIRWFSGCDDEHLFRTLRTGRFLNDFKVYKKLKIVDTYIFEDDRPVLFRVDTWHDVLIPFAGRKVMRWLFKQNFKWNSALNALSSKIDP